MFYPLCIYTGISKIWYLVVQCEARCKSRFVIGVTYYIIWYRTDIKIVDIVILLSLSWAIRANPIESLEDFWSGCGQSLLLRPFQLQLWADSLQRDGECFRDDELYLLGWLSWIEMAKGFLQLNGTHFTIQSNPEWIIVHKYTNPNLGETIPMPAQTSLIQQQVPIFENQGGTITLKQQ